MSLVEFNTRVAEMIDKTLAAGSSPVQVVGVLEILKGEIVRQAQDRARANAIKKPEIWLPRKP